MPSAIDQATQYIKANWREGKRLKEIALMYGVDPGNLERAFKRREGETFGSFMDEKRKGYVVRSLRSSSLFGYEIGAQLGFGSEVAFYRWVRRSFGATFSGLRRRLRKRRVPSTIA